MLGMTIDCALRAESCELYDTESHLVQGLTVLLRKSQSEELRRALADQREQTQEHLRRLERIFSERKWQVARGSGAVVNAILQGARSFLDDLAPSATVDSYVVGVVLRSQSLVVASYRQAAALATAMDLKDVHDSLQHSLDEELDSSERLVTLARAEIIPAAVRQGSAVPV
jgi:ferritin-like metal-binding protein YciE